jgi:hypothetical protein
MFVMDLRRRYQNHVGAYDKAKWEQTVEERILHGINHIPTKSAKLASELIDLDLVQGEFKRSRSRSCPCPCTSSSFFQYIYVYMV